MNYIKIGDKVELFNGTISGLEWPSITISSQTSYPTTCHKANIKTINGKEVNDTFDIIFDNLSPKERFILAMEKLVVELQSIDKDTPWQNTEPKWWLAMSDIKINAIKTIQEFKK